MCPKLRMVTFFLRWSFNRVFKGVTMFKLLFSAVFFGMISNVTGIPLSPCYPVIQSNRIKIELTSINQTKYSNFKQYVGSKF